MEEILYSTSAGLFFGSGAGVVKAVWNSRPESKGGGIFKNKIAIKGNMFLI